MFNTISGSRSQVEARIKNTNPDGAELFVSQILGLIANCADAKMVSSKLFKGFQEDKNSISYLQHKRNKNKKKRQRKRAGLAAGHGDTNWTPLGPSNNPTDNTGDFTGGPSISSRGGGTNGRHFPY